LKEANHVDKNPRQLHQLPTKHNNIGLHSGARQDGKFPTFDPPKHSVFNIPPIHLIHPISSMLLADIHVIHLI
jgi:hypothetical protein